MIRHTLQHLALCTHCSLRVQRSQIVLQVCKCDMRLSTAMFGD
jgi:hypothetical protein